jgi:hypothetical protein
MQQRTATAHESNASEAIVSIDGRIQRRIPNYETVVINISDSNETSAARKAINDDFANIPVLLDSVAISNETSFVRKKHGTFILGTVVSITFLWSMYSLFFLQKAEIDSNSQPLPVSSTYEINHQQKLKQLSELVLQDNDWNNSRINSILEHWSNLETPEQTQLTESAWFQHFTFAISQQIKQQDMIAATVDRSLENDPLLQLAIAMGISKENGLSAETSASRGKYQALVDQIKNEIAAAESSAKTAQQTMESEATLNNLLREKFAASNQQPSSNSALPITDVEITALLESYKEAYESGNLNALSELFGVNTSSDAENQLITNFENVINNTAKRYINFYEFTWQPDTDGLVISTKYNAMLEFTGKKGTQHIVATAKIIAAQKAKHMQIASFQVLDSQVSAVSNTLDIPSEDKSIPEIEPATINIPNAAQLQDLTTQLVTAYETGDIDHFASLFSSDAKTNDRLDLNGIREDYRQLFQSTTDRQMFIQNLQWTDASIGAKGIGDLEVIVLSNNTNTVYSMKGKIQLVVQRLDGKTLITHLYHIERPKS